MIPHKSRRTEKHPYRKTKCDRFGVTSQSIDPDTNSAKDLSYMWKIDGNEVTLDNLDK